jgi:DNA-binding NtrC family response regulator
MSELSLADTPGHQQLLLDRAGAKAIEVVPWLVGSTLQEIERELILHTLAHYLGNRTRTADVLGISIRTLRNKIRNYAAQGVSVPEPSRFQHGYDQVSQ